MSRSPVETARINFETFVVSGCARAITTKNLLQLMEPIGLTAGDINSMRASGILPKSSGAKPGTDAYFTPDEVEKVYVSRRMKTKYTNKYKGRVMDWSQVASDTRHELRRNKKEEPNLMYTEPEGQLFINALVALCTNR